MKRFTETQEAVIERFKNLTDFKLEVFLNRKLITYSNMRGQLCAVGFKGKSHKPIFHYSFENQEKRKNFIEKQKNISLNEIERKVASKEKSKKRKMDIASSYQVGSIVYSSWGYDQTNVDFYKIKEINKSTYTLVKIGKFRNYQGADYGTCTPNPDKEFGLPFKKRINNSGGFNIGSVAIATLYTGGDIYWSSYA